MLLTPSNTWDETKFKAVQLNSMRHVVFLPNALCPLHFPNLLYAKKKKKLVRQPIDLSEM